MNGLGRESETARGEGRGGKRETEGVDGEEEAGNGNDTQPFRISYYI